MILFYIKNTKFTFIGWKPFNGVNFFNFCYFFIIPFFYHSYGSYTTYSMASCCGATFTC